MAGAPNPDISEDLDTEKRPSRIPIFSCRIVNIDFELVRPGPYDIQRTNVHPDISLEKVPVIRIFGSTENGHKTCIHIHQAFPYFYIEYKGDLKLDTLRNFCIQLATSINHAVAVSLNKDPNLKVKNQYVLAVLPIKGVPFYGYYKGHRCFLKIYLYPYVNPNIVSRVAELLQMGAIMGTIFQPYDAHIPFLLQFFVDYNLYGMNYIHLDDMVPRVKSHGQYIADVACYAQTLTMHYMYTEKQPWDDSVMAKETVCEMEVDTVVGNILYLMLLLTLHTYRTHSELYDDQVNARLVHSLHALWQDEEGRRKERLLPTDAKSQAEERGYSPWNNESALRETIHSLIEKNPGVGRPPAEQSENLNTDVLDRLMTAYQAIDGLFKDSIFLGADVEPSQKYMTFMICTTSADGSGSELDPDESPAEHLEAEYEVYSSEDAAHSDFVDEDGLSSSSLSDVVEVTPTKRRRQGILFSRWKKSYNLPGTSESDDDDCNKVLVESTPTRTRSQHDVLERDQDPFSRLPIRKSSKIRSQPTKMRHTPLDQLGYHSSPRKESVLKPVVESPNDTPIEGNVEAYNHPVSGTRVTQVSGDMKTPSPPIQSQDKGKSVAHEDDPAAMNPVLSRFQWGSKRSFIYQKQPPMLEFLEQTWKEFDLPKVDYQVPFFSNNKDVPEKPRLYAGKLWKIKSKSVAYLKEFETNLKSGPDAENEPYHGMSENPKRTKERFWTSARTPPTLEQVHRWLQENKKGQESSQATTPFLKRVKHPSQIEPTTPKNRYGFKLSQFTPVSSSENQIDILCIEILVSTRRNLLPDPNVDPLKAICYAYKKFSGSDNGNTLRTG
ncbi:ribonuclease H-like protein, partial [Basidiobolus meristosporus CBS 931.73]